MANKRAKKNTRKKKSGGKKMSRSKRPIRRKKRARSGTPSGSSPAEIHQGVGPIRAGQSEIAPELPGDTPRGQS
jgi:hypothetical protein